MRIVAGAAPQPVPAGLLALASCQRLEVTRDVHVRIAGEFEYYDRIGEAIAGTKRAAGSGPLDARFAGKMALGANAVAPVRREPRRVDHFPAAQDVLLARTVAALARNSAFAKRRGAKAVRRASHWLQAAGMASEADRVNPARQKRTIVPLVSGRDVPARRGVPRNGRLVQETIGHVKVAVAHRPRADEEVQPEAAMRSAGIKVQDGRAVPAFHAIPHTGRPVRELALAFDAGYRAAATGHSRRLVGVVDFAMAGCADFAAGISARGQDQPDTAGDPQGPTQLSMHFQKSRRVPIWPVRLPLAVVTCPNSGLVMLVLMPPNWWRLNTS